MVLWKTWWAGIYRVEYCLGGNYIRRNFLDCNNPGGSFSGGNFLGGSYPGWEFSRWELSWVGIFQVGVILGGNFPGGSYPRWGFSGWELSGGIIWVGIFKVEVFLVPFLLASLLVCSLTLRLSINIMSTFMSLFSFITDVNGFFEIPTSPFIKLKKDIRKIWKFHQTLVHHLCFWKISYPNKQEQLLSLIIVLFLNLTL